MSRGEPSGEEFVLLGIPDVNGSIRGKALRPEAFEAAVQHGTVMTDLILGLDPVDAPIGDYSGSSRGDRVGASVWQRPAGPTDRPATSRRERCSDGSSPLSRSSATR